MRVKLNVSEVKTADKQFADGLEELAKKETEDAAFRVQQSVRTTPRFGGARTRNSFSVIKSGEFSHTVGSPLDVARYMNEGTRSHVIRPRNAPALRFVAASGDVVYTQKVDHPGTSPTFYFKDATENSAAEMTQILDIKGQQLASKFSKK